MCQAIANGGQVDEQEVAHYIDVLARCVAVGFFCFVLNVLYG